MKRQIIVIAIALICVATVVVYKLYSHTSAGSQESAIKQAPPDMAAHTAGSATSEESKSVGQEPPPQPPPPPPPPQVPGTASVESHRAELSRTLIGVTSEDLNQIERYLPAGSQIYTYPIDQTTLAAAVVSADVGKDGRVEIVVVYRARTPTPREGTLPLSLGVLARNGPETDLIAATQLPGEVLFDIRVDGAKKQLAVLDVTADGFPEIIVAPGTGASVGGWLEVFSLEGSSLRELGRIGGHTFSMQDRGADKPSRIVARWRGDKEARVYEWSGQKFDQTQ
jgi:hypothetical protein